MAAYYEIDIEDKRDIARRLYDEVTTPDERATSHHCSECYLDGLWMGLTRSGWAVDEFKALEDELKDMLDGLIEGEWE